MMGVNTRNMQSCLHKYNKLNKSYLVGQLLNSIHDARTHVYMCVYIYIYIYIYAGCTQKHVYMCVNIYIQGVHKRMVRFQKLTRNLFLTLHGHKVHRQQRQLSKFLLRYQQFASHAYCGAAGPVSKMASQQERAFSLGHPVRRI